MLMPRIDLPALWLKLPPADMALVRRIVRPTWRLRLSRPMLRDSAESRYAAYIWRMVASYVSPNSQHHCMPTTCYFWFPKGTDKAVIQHLDRLVDEITDTVPAEEWWGVRAWAGLTSEGAEVRKSCLKGFKSNVQEYLEDSANRKARIAAARDQGTDKYRQELGDSGRSCEVTNPFQVGT